MKKFLFILPSLILAIGFVLFIPENAFAAPTPCFVSGRVVGSLEIFHSELGTNFIAIGEPVSVIFRDSVAQTNHREVYFKLGKSAYQPYTFKDVNFLPWQYGTIFTPPNASDCGRCFANVTWRSIQDGKMHYCTAETVKYKARKNIRLDLRPSYSITYNSPSARQAVLYDFQRNMLEFEIEPSHSCSDYGFWFNGEFVSRFSQAPIEGSEKYCFLSMPRTFSVKPVPNGRVTVSILPTTGIVPGSLTNSSSFYGTGGLRLLVFDYNSSGICGGIYNR